MEKIAAVVDDEPDILELVGLHLKKVPFKVKGFSNANDFLIFLENNVPDIIILDIMLPDGDGVEICKNLKSDNRFVSVPIILLTAKSSEADKVIGLELGADDYVTKPFSPRELIARVKAVLRRHKHTDKTIRIDTDKTIRIDKILTINPDKYEVFVENRKINLTTTEFKILLMLSERRGWVFSREKIIESLWGREKFVIDRTIDVHIRHLRKKLGPASDYIKNIRGIGYKME